MSYQPASADLIFLITLVTLGEVSGRLGRDLPDRYWPDTF